MNARTAELCSEQENTDITELVVIDTIAKSTMQGVSPSANVVQFCKRRTDKNAERNIGAGNDSEDRTLRRTHFFLSVSHLITDHHTHLRVAQVWDVLHRCAS